MAYALLFDMNLLFESYVAHFFKKTYQNREVKTQDRQYKLVESHNLFQLKPDIVMDKNIVLDTKWKLINQESKNYDLSQPDLYQMYAYGKKYTAENVYLVYPKTKDFQSSLDTALAYDESLNIHILCFDCNDITQNNIQRKNNCTVVIKNDDLLAHIQREFSLEESFHKVDQMISDVISDTIAVNNIVQEMKQKNKQLQSLQKYSNSSVDKLMIKFIQNNCNSNVTDADIVNNVNKGI